MTNSPPLRIGFMGTPDFALVALKAILDAGHEVVCVYSQPPRPKGRGQQVQLSPVHAYAQDQGIPVYTPVSLKTPEAQAEFAAHELDVAIVAAYGLILPEAVLSAPKFGCLNVHASLLPRWRGAAPIQYAIWKGDLETGVTIMQMEKGLDTGPMILKGEVAITGKTTSSSLHDELAEMGGKLVLTALHELAKNGQLKAEIQDEAITTYASMLKKEDGIIDWENSAAAIDRQIRALNPWPGVWTNLEGKRLKIVEAVLTEGAVSGVSGEILDKTGHVRCGEGTLQILKIQPEGKGVMDFASALNGNYIKIGQRLV